nr:14812_t:CDS:10 [Entrophospora candida]
MITIMMVFALLLSASSYFFISIYSASHLPLNDNIPIRNNNNITTTIIEPTTLTTTTTTDSTISTLDSPQLSIFTGGHWFTGPNMITFFIRFENNQNQLNFDLSSIDAFLILGNEKVLMNGDMNVFNDHGLFTTVSMPRIDHCRSYYFELFTFDGSYDRWPKKNVLYTIEGDRCLMPLNESLAWFLFIVDLSIAFSYYTIPVQLIYFIRKAPKLPFPLVFTLFSAFIILCGTTHIVSAWMPWNQNYTLSAIIKVFCSIISLVTAGALLVIIPKALELPLLAAQYKDEISERLLSERYLRNENQTMSNFRRVIHAIRVTLSKNVIYHNTVSQLCGILDADRCQIFIMKTRVGCWECVQDYFNPNQIAQQNYNTTNSQLNPNSLMVRTVFKDNIVTLLNFRDTELYDLYINGKYNNLDRTILVPIPMPENEFGIIVLQRWKVANFVKDHSREDWTSNTLTFLADLAEQISIALVQSNLIEQDKARINQLAEKNKALELARKEASAIHAHREFLAVISHEMRTPLYAIFALTSILLETPSISNNSEMNEVCDMLEIIKKSGDMLIAIINNVLDFSKYEEGHLHLERVPFCVQEVIETSLDIVALQDQESSRPRINYYIDKKVPYNVIGDMTRFRQIIVNLLSNACKFTQTDGDVMIKVDSEYVTISDVKKVKIIVEVTDTGIGISKKVLPRLFKKFSQADASITRRYGGTGLGLAIVSKLVGLMGGDIHVEQNTRDKSGTRMMFYVYLEEDLNSLSYPILSPTKTSKPICILEKNNSNRIGLKQLDESTSFVLIDSNTDEKTKMLLDFSKLDDDRNDSIGSSNSSNSINNNSMDNINVNFISNHYNINDISYDSNSNDILNNKEERITMTSNNNNNNNKLQNGMFKKQQKNSSRSNTLPNIKTANQISIPSSSIKIMQQSSSLQCNYFSNTSVLSPPRISSNYINGNYNNKDDFGLPKLEILIVEDNQINQMVTSRILSKLNQGCEIAGDGKTAIKKCDEKIYDVIFMDISMADMANALWHDRLNCIESGMNDFVSKPAKKEDIKDAPFLEKQILVIN